MRTLYNGVLARQAMQSSVHTNGTVQGVAVDLGVFANDFRDVLFVVSTDAVTDGTHLFSAEESADGSTGWTAIPAARILGTAPSITTANPNTVFTFGVIPSSFQFVRCVVTTSGATTGGVYAAKALLGGGTFGPVLRS